MATSGARSSANEAPKETSASIPAIEVRSGRQPAEVTTMRLSVANDPPKRPGRIVAATASLTALVVGGLVVHAPR